KQRDLIEYQPQVGVVQMKVARTREVHQDLHHAVQAVDLAVNDVHMPAGVWVRLLQLVPEQLQMEHDGIDRVLDLVRHPSSHAAAGRDTARELDLVFNAA